MKFKWTQMYCVYSTFQYMLVPNVNIINIVFMETVKNIQNCTSLSGVMDGIQIQECCPPP